MRLLDYARTLPPEGTPPVLKVDVRPYAEGIERLLGLHGDSRGTRASAAAQTAARFAACWRIWQAKESGRKR